MYRKYGKRVFDLVLTIPALMILFPLMAALALLVRLMLGSPVLFRQMRPGIHGRPFELIKFRSMIDACNEDGSLRPDIERLTRFGRFLRMTSLDELPELWNVLRGEMSLVGPRPLLMDYLPWYTPREKMRHELRPGLTGLAQISGRNLVLWDERLEMDVQYVARVSFRLDVYILFTTLHQALLQRNVVAVPGGLQGRLNVFRARTNKPDGNRISKDIDHSLIAHTKDVSTHKQEGMSCS